jgi:DNA-binding NarL/FixJ family response regulator
MKRRNAIPAADPEQSLASQELAPPTGLAAYRLHVGETELVVLEWPIGPALEAGTALTPAEREVVELALAGLSNPQIARHRRCSTRTIANELAAAYRKLGIGSRAELGSWAARKGGSAS